MEACTEWKVSVQAHIPVELHDLFWCFRSFIIYMNKLDTIRQIWLKPGYCGSFNPNNKSKIDHIKCSTEIRQEKHRHESTIRGRGEITGNFHQCCFNAMMCFEFWLITKFCCNYSFKKFICIRGSRCRSHLKKCWDCIPIRIHFCLTYMKNKKKRHVSRTTRLLFMMVSQYHAVTVGNGWVVLNLKYDLLFLWKGAIFIFCSQALSQMNSKNFECSSRLLQSFLCLMHS